MKVSFEPVTLICDSPAGLRLSSASATTETPCGVNPFRSIRRRSSESFTLLPGLSVTLAQPSFNVTFADVTPSTFCKATLTAWAQIAQSMP